MIKLDNNTVLRNLEEQVQYLTDYHAVNQGLVQWGIKVVGQVDTEADLPNAATYKGEYGDAYAVGTAAPYNFFIWTRASIVGEPGYWFPFGQISIVGPQGPKGDKGEKGDRGEPSRWVTVSAKPTSMAGYKLNDMALNVNNGDVYRVMYSALQGNVWTLVGNIRGAQGIQGIQGPAGPQGIQGIQGPKGDTGDVGGFINIYGIVTNVNQLPNPDTLNNRTIAYLLGTEFPYNLYIQVGDEDGPVNWVDAGPLNVSTLVTVNGEYQNVWDADTKVDTSVVENLTDLSIPFWLDGKLQPLEGLKTYRDGKQVYLGTDTDEKLALQQNQIYLQDLLPENDPRKVLVSARTGVSFDNFAKRTVYGYDSIDTVPSINNEFGNYNETQRKRLIFPNKSGTIAIAEDVYTKTEIDSKYYGLPQLAGFTVDYSKDFTYNGMSCTGTRYIKGTSKAIVFDVWRTANQTVTPNPIDAVIMTLGRWNTPGIRLDQLLSVSSLGAISDYKYIYPIEAHWVVKPEVNGFQFNDSGFVVPQVYDVINTHGQATVWGMGVRFTDANANSNLTVSGEYIRVMLTNFE